MTRSLRHSFVEFIPDELETGVVYVSIPYATAVHACACGCGEEIVTPLSPTDWTLLFDGDSISLAPSIGNWGFRCRSHYWITKGEVVWAPQWSQRQIAATRVDDRINKRHYYEREAESEADAIGASADGARSQVPREGLWERLKKVWR